MDVQKAIIVGTQKGLRTTWQLTKLIIPIYFAMVVLKHTPLMPLIATVFRPVLGLVGLPGESALAIVMGIFVNIYAGIAVILPLITTIPMSPKQITILAVMILICHNILIESAVSKQTGVPFWHVTTLRATAAFTMGLVLNWVM